MGQPDMRRLLVSGAISAISSATRKGIDPNGRLARLLARMLRKKAAIAVASKIARMIWAVVVGEGGIPGESGRPILTARPGTEFAEGVSPEANSGEFRTAYGSTDRMVGFGSTIFLHRTNLSP